MKDTAPVVYRGGFTDSSRWEGFAFRPGDIVISTPAKCGTTWLQMICALLIFQTPELPAPLTSLSPWLDMRLRPVDEVLRRLAAQRHRRFIKTHTPLDGLPQADGVHYLTLGRDPRDVAVSMDHHRANLDSVAIEALLDTPAERAGQRAAAERSSWPDGHRERVLKWIHDDRPPAENQDSLRGLVQHLGVARSRRHDPAVTLLHYDDLTRELERHMRLLAARLGIFVPPGRWPVLVEAAGFEPMKARAAALVPDEGLGMFSDSTAFFRAGAQSRWRQVLTEADLEGYRRELHSLAGPDLAAWLELGSAAVPRVHIDDTDSDDGFHYDYQGKPFTGDVVDITPAGRLVDLSEVIDGVPDGVERGWYPDGTLQVETYVSRGWAVGTSRRWHPNGRLAEERDFRNGDLVALRHWDPDGNRI